MKFVHFADCHIGGWRIKELQDCNIEAFRRTISRCKEINVDFIVISGDLFNNALPGIDKLKTVTKEFYELKKLKIPIYFIAGSHDYSPSGKTMLDVLEEAGLIINVSKAKIADGKLRLLFTQDEKTGAKLTGLLGKRGMLDKQYYEILDREYLEKEEGKKIFLFHTAIDEYKPKSLSFINCTPLSFFPRNFFYYAGGHVHIVMKRFEEGYGVFCYPGALFPNSFDELEEWKCGGFYIVEDEKISYEQIKIKEVVSLIFSADGKTPEEVNHEIIHSIKNLDVNDKIITIRVRGKLSSGKIIEIKIPEIAAKAHSFGAYSVLYNTSKLVTEVIEEIKIETRDGHNFDGSIIKEHLTEEKVHNDMDERMLAHILINSLCKEKEEGETKTIYEERIKHELKDTLPELFEL